jgi:hypothetical protein
VGDGGLARSFVSLLHMSIKRLCLGSMLPLLWASFGSDGSNVFAGTRNPDAICCPRQTT